MSEGGKESGRVILGVRSGDRGDISSAKNEPFEGSRAARPIDSTIEESSTERWRGERNCRKRDAICLVPLRCLTCCSDVLPPLSSSLHPESRWRMENGDRSQSAVRKKEGRERNVNLI